jgi:arylsulfatase A-like enzyme
LSLADDTVVVVTSDHGEGLGDHNYRLHGVNLYEEAVRAVLMIRWPNGIDARRIRDVPVEHVDVLPTVLELAGVARPADAAWQGRSLAAALRGTASFDRDHPVFLHRRLFETVDPGSPKAKGMLFAVRQGRWKYIAGREEGVHELFDLEADPAELRNVLASEPERGAELASLLESWEAKVLRTYEHGRSDDQTRERLRALGYVE